MSRALAAWFGSLSVLILVALPVLPASPQDAKPDVGNTAITLAQDAKVSALLKYAGHRGALRAAWSDLTVDQQRTIISESLGKVTILPAPNRGPRFDPSRIVIGASTASKKPR